MKLGMNENIEGKRPQNILAKLRRFTYKRNTLWKLKSESCLSWLPENMS